MLGMQIAPQHSQNLRRSSATFFVRLDLIVVALQPPGAVLAQTPGPDDFAHFTYDREASLNVKQIWVKVRDRVTIQTSRIRAPMEIPFLRTSSSQKVAENSRQ